MNYISRMPHFNCKRALAAAALGVLLVACAKPTPQYQRLPDGSEVFFLSDSKLTPVAGYPSPREIAADGEFFFRVAESAQPLTLRSRLLVLTVTGKTDLRLTAYSREAGEQVEVLSGHVVARKSYASNYMEPDVLTTGQMSMINKDIDLMEKETADLPALRAWSDALVASAARKN